MTTAYRCRGGVQELSKYNLDVGSARQEGHCRVCVHASVSHLAINDIVPPLDVAHSYCELLASIASQ
jgi:hypothetical protein